MRHSLLSRFQGVFLAAALGEELDRVRQSKRNSQSADQQNWLLHRWHPGSCSEDIASQSWMRVAVQVTEAVILAQGQYSSIKSINATQIQTAAELALITLPISLFFHDSLVQQRQQLTLATQTQGDLAMLDGALVIGYTIAQALTERLSPLYLIPGLIRYLKQEHTTSNVSVELIDILERTQALLRQSACLQTVVHELSEKKSAAEYEAIGLALYCFLSNPHQGWQALSRAAYATRSSSLLCALVGALSGAYNGLPGIPLAWRIASAACPELPMVGRSRIALTQLATQLLIAWSGAYQPTAFSDFTPAIAAPGTIRPH